MQFTQNLNIKQSQSLTMSPQLQQAIKLLQMTNFELHEYLETQFNNNPLIDIVPSEPPIKNERSGEDNTSQESVTKDAEQICENSFSDCKTDITSSMNDAEFKNIGDYKNFNGGDTLDENSHYNFCQEIDLRQFLSNQLDITHAPQDILLIASYLIGSLSDTGYLHETCAEIAAHIMQPVKKVEVALQLCQQFEPAGVFARNLAECLRLQLVDQKFFNKKYALLLDNLEDLGMKRYSDLLKKVGVTKETLLSMITQIKRLYPKPGLQYSSDPIMPVIPDVFIQDTIDGGWQVMLNHATMPRAIINQTYSVYLNKNKDKSKMLEKTTKRYLKESYHQASWVIKSLEQRSDTILRVASEILRQQDGFFAYGFEHLKPMNLKIVAEELELHESTISRVTAGKYLRCPRGTFEMKFFFMSGITGKDGEASVASQSVKHEIKKMIDAESPKNILSDGGLVALLKKKDIEIARRTVAKYRESMNIPSSVKRRAQKNNFF
ncbi:MAG: RNA polymerase sigma-54 factor [Alphaproteobacteria bacterium]|jgi:RNA polymerase sigma-54 factor